MTVLAYTEADHSRRELGFQDDQLAMVRKRTSAGVINFEIRYRDYHDIGGVMFAYQVAADFPAAQTRVSFAYKRPIVNGKIADSVFTLTPGPDAKQVDIGMLRPRARSARWVAACARLRSRSRCWRCSPGCRVQHASDDHAKQQIFYQASLGDPRTFNPILSTDSSSDDAVSDVFDSIVRMNELTMLPEPGLAESWDIAPDQKSITFHLRQGIKWSDGAPFTSHDVAFTMQVMYDQQVPNSMRSILTIDGKPIEVTTPDDYTVVMRLPRPFAPLLYSIGAPIIPAHVLEPDLPRRSFQPGVEHQHSAARFDRTRPVRHDALRAEPASTICAESPFLDAR